jgi:membrane-bound lytic murein transglycosylase D
VLTLLILSIYTFPKNRNNNPEFSSYLPAEEEFSNPIEEKIYWLDQITPLNLVYNSEVEYYIDLYLTERKNSLKYMLARAEIYFPVIESYLDKYNIPLEIKYLAALESGLNPFAQSKSGAYGLWQHLYSTCSLLDLEVNSYIDDRYDIHKSTDAACRYLSYLYRIFHDWDLAMAAYNDGPGTVSRAITRSGGVTNYWELREHLPFQSSQYIPAFIAFNYLFQHFADHGISFDKIDKKYTETDTIWIYKDVSFEQIASQINLSVEDLRFLNPRYKRNYIPKQPEPFMLVLPQEKIMEYIQKEYQIDTTQVCAQNQESAKDTNTMSRITHTVQKGEFFHKLAMKYNCTIENIKTWNQLEENDIYPGQLLNIWIAKE